ncbi:polyprenyl synthetase family protein [Coxiella endosymbiont of Amblyomma americanum]|uniref:polyprenyl synthetase family protein n=1 Tax=Coxiella endosymbiont of Amblyomma americanum TaxID=325775 RepID=UPI0005805A53|nr:polyprenyl synthetase family protein [Coxiella endosymbiont of Amblyomma americanum]AUJ58854.1 polyprenyl synthetase [Coxiella-like endosymbiont of Amblyomma americanum]
MLNFFLTYQSHINHRLENLLPDQTQSPILLHQAMHYSVMSKGKRLRPLLVYATGFFFGTDPIQMDNIACAVELIHCYSLVHDDLPAMDNDNYRRGKPSCHKAFDEATAILVGDALQSLAFEILARENNSHLVAILAHACGSLGMAGGQQLDLSNKSNVINENIYHLKTSALFCATIELSALYAQCVDENLLRKLRKLGAIIGLIYQLRDDLNDRFDIRDKTYNIINERINLLYKKAKYLTSKLDGNIAFINSIVDFLHTPAL